MKSRQAATLAGIFFASFFARHTEPFPLLHRKEKLRFTKIIRTQVMTVIVYSRRYSP